MLVCKIWKYSLYRGECKWEVSGMQCVLETPVHPSPPVTPRHHPSPWQASVLFQKRGTRQSRLNSYTPINLNMVKNTKAKHPEEIRTKNQLRWTGTGHKSKAAPEWHRSGHHGYIHFRLISSRAGRKEIFACVIFITSIKYFWMFYPIIYIN